MQQTSAQWAFRLEFGNKGEAVTKNRNGTLNTKNHHFVDAAGKEGRLSGGKTPLSSLKITWARALSGPEKALKLRVCASPAKKNKRYHP